MPDMNLYICFQRAVRIFVHMLNFIWTFNLLRDTVLYYAEEMGDRELMQMKEIIQENQQQSLQVMPSLMQKISENNQA